MNWTQIGTKSREINKLEFTFYSIKDKDTDKTTYFARVEDKNGVRYDKSENKQDLIDKILPVLKDSIEHDC